MRAPSGILLLAAIFSDPHACQVFAATGSWPQVELRGVGIVAELQTKMERYEIKAAQCRESAAHAPEGPQREFFVVLAGYYGELAKDFRRAIARRTAA